MNNEEYKEEGRRRRSRSRGGGVEGGVETYGGVGSGRMRRGRRRNIRRRGRVEEGKEEWVEVGRGGKEEEEEK